MAVGLSWTAVGRVVRERGARLAARDRRRADLQFVQPLPRVGGDPILTRSSLHEVTYKYAGLDGIATWKSHSVKRLDEASFKGR